MLPRVSIRDDGAAVKTQYSDTGYTPVKCERQRTSIKYLVHIGTLRGHIGKEIVE